MSNISTRNASVDVFRGMAMLMVVLGHTMSGCTINSQNSIAFNIIWSLQMPLFMLISGYVNRYTNAPTNFASLGKLLIKRTISYLLPWIIWTFLIRGIIFSETLFLNLKWIVYNMDSGYWFIFSIWTISMIFNISRYVGIKVSRDGSTVQKNVYCAIFYLLGTVVCGVIALKYGLTFLGLKLTIYYMPFYYAGYLFSVIQNELCRDDKLNVFCEVVIAVSCAIYVLLLSKVNLYYISDNFSGIIIRIISSLFGCITIIGLLKKWTSSEGKLQKIISWIGVHSLEIYLIHYLVLSILQDVISPDFVTPRGIILVAANFLITTCLACLSAYLLDQNYYLRCILFGKYKNNKIIGAI